jgi:hypothetical protein
MVRFIFFLYATLFDAVNQDGDGYYDTNDDA